MEPKSNDTGMFLADCLPSLLRQEKHSGLKTSQNCGWIIFWVNEQVVTCEIYMLRLPYLF